MSMTNAGLLRYLTSLPRGVARAETVSELARFGGSKANPVSNVSYMSGVGALSKLIAYGNNRNGLQVYRAD